MKLSMIIIADRLSAYSPEIDIVDGNMEISGARLLTAAIAIRRDILYITSARSYFDDEKYGDCVLCIHGLDWIKLKCADENEALTAVLDILEEFNAWETALRDAVESGLEMQYIIDLSRYALPFPILITDALGNVVGYSKGYIAGEVDIFWDSIVLHGKIHDRMFTGSLMDNQSQAIYDWEVIPKIYNTPQRRIIGIHLIQNEEKVGAITIVEHGRSLTEGDCQLADVFRNAASAAISKRGRDAELRTVAVVMQEYLDGKNADEEYLWQHILNYTGNRNEDLEIVLFRNTKRADFNYKSNMSFRLVNSEVDSLCVPYHDFIMAVVTCSNEGALLAKARERMIGDDYICGISLPFSSAEALCTALGQAMLAIKIGDKTAGAINRCVDYAYVYFLNQLAEYTGVVSGLLHPALAFLKRYDEKHKTSLYETLYEYLRLERNVVATAKHLYIHRNSMIYRLQRLENLLNLDLDNVNTRMYLLLSYHIDMTHNNSMRNNMFFNGVHRNE